MEQAKLAEILESHKAWLAGRGGKHADLQGAGLRGAGLRGAGLRGANLRGANLRGANLRGADLPGAGLRGANLRGANLRGANLRGADLRGAGLRGANLRGADLRGADLQDANLRGAFLRGAFLQDADLRDADLQDADLRGADLRGVRYDYSTSGFHLACPESGSFVAYASKSRHLLKLQIPASAKRSSATSRKCRASKVKVLSIEAPGGESVRTITHEAYGHSTVYEVGKITHADTWCTDRWQECAPGIHFFLTEKEARDWNI
jgi:hypothetical protein